jgi:hypothetical protein
MALQVGLAWLRETLRLIRLQIFTADEPEVEALPRSAVMDYLDKVDQSSCRGYLEHIINSLHEEGADFHDKLAEFYLEDARKSLNSPSRKRCILPGRTGLISLVELSKEKSEEIKRFLAFLNNSTHYRPYRLLSKLNVEGESPHCYAAFILTRNRATRGSGYIVGQDRETRRSSSPIRVPPTRLPGR